MLLCNVVSHWLSLYPEWSLWFMRGPYIIYLTHWGQVMHICVGKLTIIASDNGLSPGRCQAIIWNNAGILLIGPLGTKLNEIFIEIHTFSFKKMHLNMSSAKWRPFCLGLNVLRETSDWVRWHSISDLKANTSHIVNNSDTALCYNLHCCKSLLINLTWKVNLTQWNGSNWTDILW